MARTKLSLIQIKMLAARKPLSYGRLKYNLQEKDISLARAMSRSFTLRKHFDLYLDFSDGHLEIEPIPNDPGLCKKPGRKKKGVNNETCKM